VIQPCPACGQKNRTIYERLGETGQCGRCKGELAPPAAPVEVRHEADFYSLVGDSPLPVLVDFWAPWCGPCRQVAPELVRVAQRQAGKLLVAKVNTEQLPTLATQHHIRSIPTMSVFVQGREVNRTMGARPAAAIEDFLRESLV
jgi:thioredoxin 2